MIIAIPKNREDGLECAQFLKIPKKDKEKKDGYFIQQGSTVHINTTEHSLIHSPQTPIVQSLQNNRKEAH